MLMAQLLRRAMQSRERIVGTLDCKTGHRRSLGFRRLDPGNLAGNSCYASSISANTFYPVSPGHSHVDASFKGNGYLTEKPSPGIR
jgi:hypothetical protein